MKTRFSPLVKLKKNEVQKSEQALQKANNALINANMALESSYEFIESFQEPKSGTMADMLAAKLLLSSQREVVAHNIEWVAFAQKQLQHTKNKLKLDMLEHEKFKYLELQEIKEELKKRKLQESKELDEIALMTFKGNKQ